jgi:hypothetical protein
MKYSREDFPEYFCVRARTQEEANAIAAFGEKLGMGTIGSRQKHHWGVYEEDTVYYFESNQHVLYGNYTSHMNSLDEEVEGYTRHVMFDNLSEVKPNSDQYEIY